MLIETLQISHKKMKIGKVFSLFRNIADVSRSFAYTIACRNPFEIRVHKFRIKFHNNESKENAKYENCFFQYQAIRQNLV